MPRGPNYNKLMPAFLFCCFMEGHQKVKTPFLNSQGAPCAFSSRNKHATSNLSSSGKLALNRKYLSLVLSPAMEALCLLWFAKYLLHLANKRHEDLLSGDEMVGHHVLSGGFPVTAWNDKGSRKTYSEVDHAFFSKKRTEILKLAKDDELKEVEERYGFQEFPELEQAIQAIPNQGLVVLGSNQQDQQEEMITSCDTFEPCDFQPTGQ